MPILRVPAAIACLLLASCGDPAPAAAAKPVAQVRHVDDVQASDIGASLVGCSITIPAMHELELAVVVVRDGAFSPADSHQSFCASSNGQTIACRVIAFAAHGPLRPDAEDLLVLADGRTIRHADTASGSSYGYATESLAPGDPCMQLAHMEFGSGNGTWTSDPRQADNIALGVYIYGRLVAVGPGHPRYADLAAHPQYTRSSSGPLRSLDDIVPPAPGAPGAPGANPSF